MRRMITYTLALPIALAAAGCGPPDQEVSTEDPPAVNETTTDTATVAESPPEDTTAPAEGNGGDGEYAFGEGAAFPHPVGSYEEEYEDGVEADVVYTVDDVASATADRVEFTLTVEVPELERVLGLGNLDVQCSYDEGLPGVAVSDDPVVEAEAGTHSMEMYCDAPESPEAMTVSVINGDDEAEFSGPVG